MSFREKRQRLDPKDYTIGDLTGETVAKMPGEINGQQFIIQNNKVRILILLTIPISYCIVYIGKKGFYASQTESLRLLTFTGKLSAVKLVIV